MKCLVPAVIVLCVIGIGIFTLHLLDHKELALTVQGEHSYTVEYGESFRPPEAEAVFRHSLLPFKKKVEVSVRNPFNPEKLGEYTVVYTAAYKDYYAEKKVRVELVDKEAPVITLKTDPDQKNGVDTEYREEGYSAWDNYDGDITDLVVREYESGETKPDRASSDGGEQEPADGKAPAPGRVTYTVRDSSGNETSVTRTVEYTDMPPVLELLGDLSPAVEVFTPYEDPGFSATDDLDGDITDRVTVSGLPDINTPGEYEITYTVKDRIGQSAEKKRRVTVRDTIPPVITLVVNSPYTRPGTQYQEEGYSAFDNVDGDLTAAVVREESPDRIVYRVTDGSGNTAETVREIIYKDAVPPQLVIGGERRLYLPLGTPYTEPGYSASDDVDGDITDRVQVSGGVNSDNEGVYTLTYSVSDSEGNTASAERQVLVFRPQTQETVEHPGGKVIYLTFDDGPGPHTERLLAILDKYNVKATFFVTNQDPGYRWLIRETANRGHTVAVHTMTHQYQVIYSSEEAYWNDFNEMNAIIEAETGAKSDLLRFPGGTSNTVSRNYCEGIMTALSQSADRMGIRYCDWNVESGDASGGTASASEIAAKVIAGVQGHDQSIVLQHDIWGQSVDAVEEIIAWGLANGYTFLPITGSTPLVHQPVQN